ncbi:MAG: two-component system sensor histidine kinase NtrB [Chloroflexota bacterium]
MEELTTYLELIPRPALLVEYSGQKVLAANGLFLQLSGYTHPELAGRPAHSLFTDWHTDPQPDPTEPPAAPRFSPLELVRQNQAHLAVQTLRMTYPSRPKLQLVVFSSSAAFNQTVLSVTDQTVWEGLSQMAGAVQQATVEQALEQLLRAGMTLSGAALLAVYRLQENSPLLERCAWLGDYPELAFNDGTAILPGQLPAQELLALNKPTVWETGRRTAATLQRLARASGMSRLASAPIGQPRAVTGLLVFACRGAGGPPVNYLANLARLLAATATSIFQHFAWAGSLAQQLDQQGADLQALETLEDSAGEGIVRLDTRLCVRSLNPAAEQMLGYSALESTGQPAEHLLIGADGLQQALTAALSGSATPNLGQVYLYRRNGEPFFAQVRVYPTTHQGQISQVLVLIQDQSEKEQIRRQSEQLEQHALLGEVTAIFAHEVLNPINNISTGLQVMGMNLPSDDPGQENVARMLQDCDRLTELMKSVLAFAKPAEYEMEPLDIGGVLERLVGRLQARIARHRVQCDLQIDPAHPALMGNARALEQVFSNLVTNALQAMGENGSLAIKVRTVYHETRDYIEVSVADTGPGIPPENLERIFQPFFTTKSGGTGLGLAISKRIITAHHGDMRVHSFPGGTIFTVRLPVHHH